MQSKCDKNFSENKGAPSAHLYEYAVVRFVPSVERGEFVNIGLIMMCKKPAWIRCKFELNPERLQVLCPGIDLECLSTQLRGFERVAGGNLDSGSIISSLETHERFRWLTAVRSASLQTSRPHAGIADNLDDTFDRLFDRLVRC